MAAEPQADTGHPSDPLAGRLIERLRDGSSVAVLVAAPAAVLGVLLRSTATRRATSPPTPSVRRSAGRSDRGATPAPRATGRLTLAAAAD